MSITVNGTTGFTFSDASTQSTAADSGIKPISASVLSNVLTITLNPCPLQFRSSTLGSGIVTASNINSAISIVIPSTATLGTINAVQSRLVVIAINNAGTVELAVVNIAGGNNLDETKLINTTAIATGSNAANVIYSTTARTSVPFRVVGYVESTQATAGTWATAPSTVQGSGGQALAAMSSLGYGQTYQSLGGSRAFNTTYYNTTGKPIFVSVESAVSTISSMVFLVNGAEIAYKQGEYTAGIKATIQGVVPTGSSYQVSSTGSPSISLWNELR